MLLKLSIYQPTDQKFSKIFSLKNNVEMPILTCTCFFMCMQVLSFIGLLHLLHCKVPVQKLQGIIFRSLLSLSLSLLTDPYAFFACLYGWWLFWCFSCLKVSQCWLYTDYCSSTEEQVGTDIIISCLIGIYANNYRVCCSNDCDFFYFMEKTNEL